MRNLIELAGRLVRGPDDCEHQPLRCEAASALKDAHYEIERLQEEREAKDKIIEQLRKMVVKAGRLEYKFGLIQGRIGR